MKKVLPFALLFSLALSFVSAQVQNYRIVPEESTLSFDASAQVHKVHGVSSDFSGTISGDPKDITAAKITIRLDPKNFDTDNDKRDKVMRQKSLEIDKYPFIEFESSSIQAVNKELIANRPADATIQGTLKLHGIEKEIAVPVQILWDEHQLAAQATMDVNLDEFGIFRPKVLFFRLQEEVNVRFRIVAERILEEGYIP